MGGGGRQGGEKGGGGRLYGVCPKEVCPYCIAVCEESQACASVQLPMDITSTKICKKARLCAWFTAVVEGSMTTHRRHGEEDDVQRGPLRLTLGKIKHVPMTDNK